MSTYHKIISYIFYIIYKFGENFNFYKKDTLRVLMYHDIKQNDFKKFDQQIKLFKKDNWNFLTPEEFLDYKIKKKKIYGKNLLLTFDDGFFSNITVSQKILKKYGIKAIFFIPTKFINSRKKSHKINFIKKNLKLYNYKNYKKKISLGTKDLISLIKYQNYIGAHTYSHIPLNKIKNLKKIKKEIIDSSKLIENIINRKLVFFAFPFGTSKDINFDSIKIAKKKYKLIFSAIRGNNINNKFLIFRDNIDPNYSKYFSLTILNGFYDFMYFFSRKKILNYLN